MIAIRDRTELERHLENLLSMARAESRWAKRTEDDSFANGRVHGLLEALEAIRAWRDDPPKGRPSIEVLDDQSSGR
jgi:hypothetical protein